jgi:hypothetical protein
MIAMFTLTSAIALADQMGPDGDKFYEAAAHFENACMNGPCQGDYTKKLIYDQKRKFNKLSEKEQARMKSVAVDQAQVWGDTILEGDYFASGRVRLDQVVAFYKADELVGYKIQYSEKAWYTGECQFNGKRETLKDCQEGRIVEGSYVSPDTQTYFSDEERSAKFSTSSL